MKRYISGLILIVGLVFSTSPAKSEVIYDSGMPNLNVLSPYSDYDYPQQTGGTFLLQANKNIITDVHWWGYYSGSITEDDFTIRIFNMGETSPEQTPSVLDINVGAAQRTDSGDDVNTATGFQRDLYEYFVYIEPLLLSPDTSYLLSIVNNTEDITTDWVWAVSTGDFTYWRTNDEDDTWAQYTNIVAFQLTYEQIPEPSTILLLGFGLAGVGLLRRRFKN